MGVREEGNEYRWALGIQSGSAHRGGLGKRREQARCPVLQELPHIHSLINLTEVRNGRHRLLHFVTQETEALGGEINHPRSHNQAQK